MSAFRARYRGTCRLCLATINPGDEITWARCAGDKAGVVHRACRLRGENPPPPGQEIPDEIKGLAGLPDPNIGNRDPDDLGENPQDEQDAQAPAPPPNTPTPKPQGEGGEGGQPNPPFQAFQGVLGYNGSSVKNVPLADLASALGLGEQEQPEPEAPETPEAPTLDADAVRAIVDPLIREALANGDGAPFKVEIHAPGKVVKVEGAHRMFGKLLFLVGQGQHVYLYGPPGGGKSHAAAQVAETLERPYGYISLNPQTPDSRLLGFQDASGNYRPTVFRKVYEGGGVFCIDELDNASPSLLTTLNGCLENGLAAFPDGMVKRHPDFVVVATGNTSGKGANPAFPDRRPFDMAFAERFSYLEWGYDTRLEKRITLSINSQALPWFKWVQTLRKWAASDMPRLIVSPRASFRLALYTRGDCPLTSQELVNSVVFRGLDAETVKRALADCPLPSTLPGEDDNAS